MSYAPLVFKNTISQLLGKGVTGAIAFITSILLARALGAEGFGDYTKITTFVAFFYLFCDFGLNAAYLQVSEEKHSSTMHKTLFTTRSMTAIIATAIALFLLLFLPGAGTNGYSDTVKRGIILFLPTIFFQSLITTTNAVFQKNMAYHYATVALFVGSVLSLLAVVIAWYNVPPQLLLFAFVAANVLGSMVISGVALLFVKRLVPPPLLLWNSQETKEFFFRALPLGLTLLFNVVYFHVDSIILTVFRTTIEVGVYGLAYKFFEFILVIPTFFMNAVVPLLVQAHTRGDRQLFWRRIRKTNVFLLASSLAIGGMSWMMAPFLSVIKLEFGQSIVPFRILLLGLPFYFLSNCTMWILVIKKYYRQLLFLYGFFMIVNIVANLLFIPRFGYIAAAWITILSEFFIFAGSIVAIRILDKNS